MHHATLLGLLATAATVAARPSDTSASAPAIKCPIVFDGRVKVTTQLADFDSASTSIFDAKNVKGNNLQWSQIIKFPSVANARFDNDTFKPIEVTISDQSIFQKQNGFRRAGLLFRDDTNKGSPGSSGVKTIHFSVRLDAQRPLNLTHEYLNVWHEASDFSANQFNFQAGSILGQANLPRDTWKVLDRSNKQIWATPVVNDDWQNFAITLDFNKNTLQVFYSKGCDPLKSVTSAVPNNNAGEGQYQIGMLKKPTDTRDVVNSGFQESNLNEGLIYGSVFVEDSAGGCVSL